MQRILLPLFIFLAQIAYSQCISFKLTESGDTLNCTDIKGFKQGKWVVKVAPLRGEPGYEEEGIFLNDRKEGVWRKFNMMGDLIAQENYKWGNKNGKCSYFTINGLEHTESWRAVNPDKLYDTIDVQDPINPNKYEKIIVRTDGSSLKHGIWKYYNPSNGALIDTEEYFLGETKNKENPEQNFPDVKNAPKGLQKDSTTAKQPQRPKEIMDFEKKNAKKKNVKVLDGRTGY